MSSSKYLKPLIPCLIVAAVATACIVFYFSTSAVGVRERFWIQWFGSSQANNTTNQSARGINKSELVQVLKKAATADKTVIITVVNEAWLQPGSLFDIFLESFHVGEKTETLIKHLVVVAVDPNALQRCKSLHPHCFLLTSADPAEDFSKEEKFLSHDYLDMMWRRLEFLGTVLQLGYNFIFSDTDVMWLRNPFPHFTNGSHITISSDYFSGDPSSPKNMANCGFVYAKSAPQTIEFYKYWLMSRKVYPRNHEQQIFNIIKNDKKATELGLVVRFLDTTYFGGFCSKNSRDMNKICTLHANCCVGMQRKIHDLRVVVADWKNYTARPEEERRKGRFSWNVPIKCRM